MLEFFLCLGATRITSEAVIDQNTEWANAIHIRARSNIQKFHAMTDKICPTINIMNSLISRLLRSILPVASMAGKDIISTVQA